VRVNNKNALAAIAQVTRRRSAGFISVVSSAFMLVKAVASLSNFAAGTHEDG
jgi:hypothetical protein